jgi:hypothetical protein
MTRKLLSIAALLLASCFMWAGIIALGLAVLPK